MEKYLPQNLYRQGVKHWSPSALDCYEIGCDCSRCFIQKTYFSHLEETCQMKYYVEYLLEKIGIPKFDTIIY